MPVTQENEKLQALISALPDLVFVLTESGLYGDIFGGNDSTLYHEGGQLIGSSLYDVLPKEKADFFLEKIKETLDKNCLQIVEYNLAAFDVDSVDEKSGPSGTIWFEGRVKPLPFLYQNERAVVWVARNITNKYLLEQELRHLSETDGLTGVYNRRKIMERLQQQYWEFLRYGTVSSFLLFDIDDFKHINDHYGHMVGDLAIQHIVTLCHKELRHTDILGRLGGDEFAIILPHTLLHEANTLIQRITHSVSYRPLYTDHMEIPLSVSIGSSCFHEDDSEYEAVIHRADTAMYRHKNAKK